MVDRPATTEEPVRDEGAMLIFALLLVTIAALIVIPLANYAMTVTRAGRLPMQKVVAAEAVRGGLRTALADPMGIYKKCGYQDASNPGAGLYTAVELAGPVLNTPVRTRCYLMDYGRNLDGGQLKNWGVATTQVGATLSSDVKAHETRFYAASGQSPETKWVQDATVTPTQNKVWLPYLPAHGLDARSAFGYDMPANFNGSPTCRVYFPGTYRDQLVLTSTTPVFFASGIYYFEKGVRISGDAKVVVGGGATPGCATDQQAVFYAINAPTNHNVTGLGATFVFGAAGSLVVDTDTPGTAMSLQFNQRYVATGDVSTAASAGVSIMTVNGAMSGTTQTDLSMTGQLYVPKGKVSSQTITDATTQSYQPSTVTMAAVTAAPTGTTTTTAAAATTTAPPAVVPQAAVVEVRAATAQAVTVVIPGYVSIPQGLIRVATTGAPANKDIEVAGGILAANFEITGTFPAAFGLANPVVQQTFKIVSETTTYPKVTATAIAQINQNGAWKVNDFIVQ